MTYFILLVSSYSSAFLSQAATDDRKRLAIPMQGCSTAAGPDTLMTKHTMAPTNARQPKAKSTQTVIDTNALKIGGMCPYLLSP